MADNYNVKNASGTTIAIKAKEVSAGIYSPRVIPQVGDADIANGNPMPISDAGGSITVDASTLPLPTGAATAAKQPALGTAGTPSTDVLTIQGIASATPIIIGDGGGSITVDATALPLPTGAATAAKQPALGTAGTPSSDVLTIQGHASGTPLPVAPTASELHIGEIGGNTALVNSTPALSTSAYAANDVLAPTTVITGALRKVDGTGLLQSITIVDKDDQGAEMQIIILQSNVSIGTANDVMTLTDANAENILGIIKVSTADWVDLGGCKVASMRNLAIPVKAASGTADLYFAAMTLGSPTHTASGLVFRFGMLRD